MINEKKAKVVLGLMFIVVIIIGFCGCMTTEKAADYLKKKGELAQVCLEEYPIVDSVRYIKGDSVVEIIEIPSDTLIHFDTIWRNQYGYRVDTIKLKCPPQVKKYIRIVDTVEVKKIDPRQIEYWKRLFDKSQKDLEQEKAAHQKLKTKHGKLREFSNYLLAILIAILIGGGLVWWVKRK